MIEVRRSREIGATALNFYYLRRDIVLGLVDRAEWQKTRSVPACRGGTSLAERMRPAEPRKPGRGSPERSPASARTRRTAARPAPNQRFNDLGASCSYPRPAADHRRRGPEPLNAEQRCDLLGDR